LGLIESNFFGIIFGNIFFIILCITMSTGSSQRRARQRTEEGIASSKAKISNWQAILERNVVRADVLVAPLDVIDDIIDLSLGLPLQLCLHCAPQVGERILCAFGGCTG